MAKVKFYEKKGRVTVILPGTVLNAFEMDGDLEAINGTGADQVTIRRSETQQAYINNIDYTDIVKFDGTTNWGATRDLTVSNLNDQLLNKGLPYQLGLGQRVKNGSASTLYKGSPVYIKDWDATLETVVVDLSEADTPSSMPAQYILDEDIASGETGDAISYGLLSDVDTSSYIEGTKLYVDTNGSWTSTPPSSGNALQSFGVVQRQDLSSGEVLINGLGREEGGSSTSENIGNTDLTMTGNRVLEMAGYSLDFQNSASSKVKIFSTGTFHCAGRLVIDGNDTTGSQLRMLDADGSAALTFQTPTTLSGNQSWTLPGSDGNRDDVLMTNGTGSLQFNRVERPFGTITGRFQWDADDDNRTLIAGGAFGSNYYLWNTELFNTVATGTVDTTTQSVSNIYIGYGAFKMPYASKVRWNFLSRPANANSYNLAARAQIWSTTATSWPTTGTTSFTLRADVSFTINSSTQQPVEIEVETTSDIPANSYFICTCGLDNTTIAATAYLYSQGTLTLF